MQPESPKTRNDKYLFYDFETDFSTGERTVNFAVARGATSWTNFVCFYSQSNVRDLMPFLLMNSWFKMEQQLPTSHLFTSEDCATYWFFKLVTNDTLGLDLSSYSKGDFPFKFNTVKNQHYVGPLPDIEFFPPTHILKNHKINFSFGTKI